MFTSGKMYFKDVRFPICFERNDTFTAVPYRDKRLAVTFVRNGTAVLENGSRQYIITAPAVLCINEHTTLRLGDQRDFDADTVYFHPSFINANLDFSNIRRNNPELNYTEQQDVYLFVPFGGGNDVLTITPLLPPTRTECNFLFTKLDQAVHADGADYCPCRLRAVLMSLLIFLLDLEKPSAAPVADDVPADGYRLKDVTLFLYTHYGDELSVDSIAARFHTNRTTLNARFNEIFGTPVMRYVRNLRLTIAAKILRTSGKSVTETGLGVGFRDISNFCKLFKDAFGCTPSAYRRMYGPDVYAAAEKLEAVRR